LKKNITLEIIFEIFKVKNYFTSPNKTIIQDDIKLSDNSNSSQIIIENISPVKTSQILKNSECDNTNCSQNKTIESLIIKDVTNNLDIVYYQELFNFVENGTKNEIISSMFLKINIIDKNIMKFTYLSLLEINDKNKLKLNLFNYIEKQKSLYIKDFKNNNELLDYINNKIELKDLKLINIVKFI
jgi:hypothetical protein